MTVEMMKKLFVRTLQVEDHIFDTYDDSDPSTVVLNMTGDNLNEISLYVSFTCMNNGSMQVLINNFDLPNFSDNKVAGILTCNKVNDDELVKYYIDDEDDTVVQCVLMYNAFDIASEFSAAQVLIHATSMALSVDEVYPLFMQMSN